MLPLQNETVGIAHQAPPSLTAVNLPTTVNTWGVREVRNTHPSKDTKVKRATIPPGVQTKSLGTVLGTSFSHLHT